MSKLSDEYKRILSEIEQIISNEEEREIVKQKVMELTNIYADYMNSVAEKTDKKVIELEAKNNAINDRLKEVEEEIKEIERDIYEVEEDGCDCEECGEEDFDFEIVCPYCDSTFVANLNLINEDNAEIRCPECNNLIELDWSDEEDEDCCSGHCHSCHGCGEDSEEENENEKTENEDDDM